MNLENNVIIAGNWEMPEYKNIYVLLSILSSKVCTQKSEVTAGSSKDIATIKYSVSAEMMSRQKIDLNDDPRGRHIEMAMALKSYTGARLMEQDSVSIQILGECQNLSKTEGTDNLCVFRQDFSIAEEIEKSSNTDYFDKLGELTMEVQQL